MALAIANVLANGDTTNKSPGGTYTFTPTVAASDLVIVSFRTQSSVTNTADVSAMTSGDGATMTEIAAVNYVANPVLYITSWWFIANGSDTTPLITVTLGGAGTYGQAQWCVETVTGYNPTTPIAQSAVYDGTGSLYEIDLAAPPASDSITVGAGAANVVPGDIAPAATYTQLGEFDTAAEPNRTISTIYKANSQSAEWTPTGTFTFIAVAFEIAAAVGAGNRARGSITSQATKRGAYY